MEGAFFDLDKTIVARSSGLALTRSFLREGLIARGTLLKSLYAQFIFQLMGADEARMDRMRAEAAKLTSGWEADKVRRVVTEVLEEVISPLMYAEALELLHDHRAAGRLLCIVSSSPEEVVEPLAKMLGVDRCISTRSRIVDGVYTGDLDFYAYGPFKAHAMRELAAGIGIDLRASFAYSDSATDLPMLEAVGNPVAVNPDKELKKIAAERGWPTETFRKPVQLRDRLPQLRGETPVGSTLAAATGAVGLAIVTWWLIKRWGSGETGAR
jgi:HAD superfamily hydrolase (TIGR01490 family)